eukprot:scaffold2385_cov178-Amphora_coffeaeformis.AAC.6
MPTAAALHPTSPNLMQQQQQQQQAYPPVAPKPQLRRAVYVHVSDLLSAYNIDHARLEEELLRVKQNKSAAATVPSSESSSTGGGSTLGVPTELDTNPNPKKLQPPRGGFNLCVLVGNVDLVVDKHRVDGSRGKHIRLAVTKWGKITPYPDHVASTPVPPSKMNEDRFFSLIDLSVVAMDVAPAEYQPSHHPHHHSGGYNPNAMAENEGYGGSRGGGRSGGGTGRNKPGRSKQQQQQQPPPQVQQAPALQPYPGDVPYGDVMRYPGGLHGYGYVENMDGYGGYRSRQPAETAHMMLQQQYAMHQRQIHQMYHRPPHEQPQQPQPSPSYDGSFVGSAGGAPRNDMFFMPANVFPPPQQQGTVDRGGTSTPHSFPASPTPHAFPASPKMNPRATTFDPSGKSG